MTAADAPHPLYDDATVAGGAFAYEVDLSPPDICSRETLVRLIDMAPSETSRGYLWGMFDYRLRQAQETGGSFAEGAARPAERWTHPLEDGLLDAGFAAEVRRVDPLRCTRPALLRLIGRAPDRLSHAWLRGIDDVRYLYSLYAGGSFHLIEEPR